jgi:C1A family cysteine protease
MFVFRRREEMSKMKKGFVRYGALGIGLLVLAAAAFVVFSPSSFGTTSDKEGFAPMNPEFIKFINDRAAGKRWVTVTKDGYPLGEIPSPHDTSHLIPLPDPVPPASLPKTYDLRTKNKVTSVKDQGGAGTCWTFATFGSLESYLKPGATWDFSEENLADHHGFDYGINDGGHMWMSAAYLGRWAGPLNESDDPYQYATPDGASPKKHVQNIVMMDERKSATDNVKIKNALMNNGAVYVSFCWFDSAYNSTNAAYYYSGSTQGGGHAVTIVGWDDNYSKSKFKSSPSGNGAFIVKNSWGSSWGKSGYFYVSYYDKFFGKRGGTAVFKGEPTTNYKTNYGYDPLGWIGNFGGTAETYWFSNIFTASPAGSLKAVGFYAGANSNSYEIYIYTNVTAKKPRSGTLAKTKKGTISGWGYYTIPLGTNVALASGKKFSIVVKLKTTGYKYPIPVEYKIAGYSGAAKASAGQSYYSRDGNSWTDMTTADSTCNVCLRGYTKY